MWRRRSLRAATVVGVLALAAYALSSVTTVEAVVATVGRADPTLYVLAVASYFLTVPIRTYRWQLLLREFDVSPAATDANLMMFLSLFFNSFLPAKAGDLYRCHLAAANEEISRSRTLGTVTVERVADVTALGVGVIASLLLVAPSVGSFRGVVLTVGVVFVGLAVAAAVVTFLPVSVLPTRLRRVVEEFRTALRVVASPRLSTAVAATTVAVWTLNVVRLWLIVAALGGSVAVGQVVAVALVISFLTGLPYTPAGVGFVEVGGTSTLLALGVGGSMGASIVVLDRTITLGVVGVVGALVYASAAAFRPALLRNDPV